MMAHSRTVDKDGSKVGWMVFNLASVIWLSLISIELGNHLGSPTAGAYAIVLSLVSTVAAKFYMSIVWRGMQWYSGGNAAAAVEETKEYRHDSRTQLNEAEYSPLIIAAIAASLILSELFKEKLSKTNFSCPFMMVAIGNIFYFWSRIISRETISGVPGASVRFIGLLWIAYLIGKEFM